VPFEKPLALRLAHHAENAYLSDRELVNIYDDKLESTFNESVDDLDMLGVLPYVRGFILKESNSSTIAFKGTDSLSDWVSNIHITKISVAWLDNYKPIPHAHKGFTSAYNVIREYILSLDRKYKNIIYVCGHSLGAAIATLAAMDLKISFPQKVIIIYTFASPRVGDTTFAKIFNDIMKYNTQRIYIEGDLVPKIPTTLNLPGSYNHVDEEFELESPDPDLDIADRHRIRNIISAINDSPLFSVITREDY
jgi:predicted lipase